jgi:hypothetical protein
MTSAAKVAEALEPLPGRWRRISSYCTPAVWTDYRPDDNSPTLLLICREGSRPQYPAWNPALDAAAEGAHCAILDVSLTVGATERTDMARQHIVAAYRWLLAQLVEAGDVLFVADDWSLHPVSRALGVIHRSHDAYPAAAVVLPHELDEDGTVRWLAQPGSIANNLSPDDGQNRFNAAIESMRKLMRASAASGSYQPV